MRHACFDNCDFKKMKFLKQKSYAMKISNKVSREK